MLGTKIQSSSSVVDERIQDLEDTTELTSISSSSTSSFPPTSASPLSNPHHGLTRQSARQSVRQFVRLSVRQSSHEEPSSRSHNCPKMVHPEISKWKRFVSLSSSSSSSYSSTPYSSPSSSTSSWSSMFSALFCLLVIVGESLAAAGKINGKGQFEGMCEL